MFADPKNILEKIAAAENFQLLEFNALSGGSINDVFLLQTNSGKKVIKINKADQFPKMFEAEAKGLKALRNSKTFKIPEVLAIGKTKNTAYLLLQYIPTGRPHSTFWEQFAEKLADLHKISNATFGFDDSNYIGSLPQYNKPKSSASEFYISQRLEPQFKRAAENGFSFGDLDRLYKNIACEIPNEPPALIHGDLWGGNYMIDQNGVPVLIDPAVCYGSREMDLAMMQLFGGFPERVFRNYAAVFPLEPGFNKRTDLWQLYYLLVHLNIFGAGYFGQVKGIVGRYL